MSTEHQQGVRKPKQGTGKLGLEAWEGSPAYLPSEKKERLRVFSENAIIVTWSYSQASISRLGSRVR